MKKAFLFGVMFLFAFSLVSATYYQVGEIVDLPFLETMETSDLDYSDGIGKYVYCSYELNVPNTDESCHSYEEISNGTCDAGSFVPLTWGDQDYVGEHTCGLYDLASPTGARVPLSIKLPEGTTEYAVSIISADMIFDEVTGTWVLGEVNLIDSLTIDYKTIPKPSDDFIRGLIQSILNIICEIYPFGWCLS